MPQLATTFRPGFPSFRRLLSAGAVCLALTVLALPAAAQSEREVQSLIQKVDRLQRELNDLQRSVYTGSAGQGEPRQAPSGAGQGGDGGLTQSAASRLHSRLDALEESIQEVTGQLEETRFQVRKIDQRLEKFMQDVEYRLQQLEQGGGSQQVAQGGQNGGGTASGSGNGGGQQASGSGQQTTAAGNGSGGGQGSGGDSGSRSLGQVSQQAVDQLRKEKVERQADSGQQSAKAADVTLKGEDAEAQYDYAFSLLRQANYQQAEQALQAFLDKHPEHELSGNAKYWLGETYYVRGNYDQAAVTFAEGFQNYPDSSKAPDNLLKLGMSLAQIDRKQDACGIFAELLNRYPDAAANIKQRAERERARLGCSG